MTGLGFAILAIGGALCNPETILRIFAPPTPKKTGVPLPSA